MARRGQPLAMGDDDEAVASLTVEPAAAAPAPISIDDAQEANARVREREWQAELAKAGRQEWEATKALFYPPLIERFGEDAGSRMWRAIEPILKAGRDYGRRERFRPRPPKAA